MMSLKWGMECNAEMSLAVYTAVGTHSAKQIKDVAHPIEQGKRIRCLDVLRGVAILGILMSNIQDFAGVEGIPPASLKPVFTGDHAHLNLFSL
jgi:hypothetical protein